MTFFLHTHIGLSAILKWLKYNPIPLGHMFMKVRLWFIINFVRSLLPAVAKFYFVFPAVCCAWLLIVSTLTVFVVILFHLSVFSHIYPCLKLVAMPMYLWVRCLGYLGDSSMWTANCKKGLPIEVESSTRHYNLYIMPLWLKWLTLICTIL